MKVKVTKTDNKLELILHHLVFATLVVSIIFVSYKMITTPSTTTADSEVVRAKPQYVLMLAQCFLGLFALQLPGIIERKIHIGIPSKMLYMYFIFLYCSIYLGEVREFYYNVNNWDTILHTFSGGMLGSLGFAFVSILNKSEKVAMSLSPFFICLFAFCFALSMGVFWEIYEFTFDGILGLNMQKFMLEDGTMLVGREALFDTMKDLIVDGVGAFVISTIGYFSMKVDMSFLRKMSFIDMRKKK